jgi:hypothetical protein
MISVPVSGGACFCRERSWYKQPAPLVVSHTLEESLNLSVSVHKTAAHVGMATLFLVAAISMSSAETSTSSTSAAHKKSSHTASSQATTHNPSSHTTSKSTSHKSTSHKGKKSSKTAKHGQQNIDADRTHQIQVALIREHYLDGEPSGKWDDATQKAMQKYQADNGWQNKTVPDSRALIKMGLGPNQDHLLNPESAMTTSPSQHPAGAVDPTAAKFPATENQPQR